APLADEGGEAVADPPPLRSSDDRFDAGPRGRSGPVPPLPRARSAGRSARFFRDRGGEAGESLAGRTPADGPLFKLTPARMHTGVGHGAPSVNIGNPPAAFSAGPGYRV